MVGYVHTHAHKGAPVAALVIKQPEVDALMVETDRALLRAQAALARAEQLLGALETKPTVPGHEETI